MFETLIIISAVLAIIIVVVLILAARKPDTFRIERTAVVNAPADKVFPLIADFHQWLKWSPWEGRDPALKRTYSGAERGRGAVYAWDGNKNVGSGRMEILEATQPSKIVIKLDFFKPFEGHNTAEFTMSPLGGATNVIWVMHGPAPFMSKVMQVFMNMDRMIGKDFETGLANLKTITET
ncbi:MAG TPA: SRPBCC family protein [Bradyrhizobium sp.]|uniref:SRPBCC family protein n=1 Tax=Bradyrhizobium sp. TaxID=376 RepID=UPI002CF7BE69|nr:SRPBCC family protein [Bradyrhizobium sp.]HLZ04056.1 SRPBCC family protein [Bradyrhizobium sp.]